MGKTYKDIRKFDIKRHKEGSRMQTQDMDMRTRVKPINKKKRKPTQAEILEQATKEQEDFWKEEEDILQDFDDYDDYHLVDFETD